MNDIWLRWNKTLARERMSGKVFFVYAWSISHFVPMMQHRKKDMIMEQNAPNQVKQAAKAAAVDGATLARLINEVRNEDPSVARSYDRSHNRHNR